MKILQEQEVLGQGEVVTEVVVDAEEKPSTATPERKPLATLPRFNPISLAGSHSGTSSSACIRVRLACTSIEGQERERNTEYSHRLAIKKMELETERENSTWMQFMHRMR